MENIGKYRQCFCGAFALEPDFNANTMEMGSIPEWDSVGHMELIAEIEEKFGITLEGEDILGFTSYAKGTEILKKYGIEV